MILSGFSTWEIALKPDASVLGFKVELNIFHAQSPFPRHLLTTALTSPVVRLDKTLCSLTEISGTASLSQFSIATVSQSYLLNLCFHHLRFDLFHQLRLLLHRLPQPDCGTWWGYSSRSFESPLKSLKFLKLFTVSQQLGLVVIILSCNRWIS